MSRKRKESSEEKLLKLYAQIPKIECQGKCEESCGPIGMSAFEWRRLVRAAGQQPTMRESDHGCSLLTDDGRCSVYSHRPLICRLWGVTESMPCVFGCKPERVLPDAEADELLKAAEKLMHGEPRWTAPLDKIGDLIREGA